VHLPEKLSRRVLRQPGVVGKHVVRIVGVGSASRDCRRYSEEVGLSVEFNCEPLSWVASLLDVEVGVGGWSGPVRLDGGACLA
jgi:hypothetical protein